ncbi:hypothetical protein CPB84DRAFT_271399 [Gymnopilus junonius]|uniref:Uncharacterized protein n=1 Tax=Gymnopilus junonius TaxID=109634 RepID=A0A9P5NVC3_GYMJU|nr:hypothetical protein CPB84DRAFT_271399 [Gymnopilus junonius]
MSTDSSSLSVRLPLEILYDIVDLLVHHIKQDIPSIRACSLVCQAFVPQCQAALFSTLDIFVDERRTQGDKFPNKQTRNLSEILQYKPDLAAHFHTLRWGVSRLTVNPTPGFLPVLERIQERNKIRTLQVYSKRTKQQHLSDARLLGLVIAPFITRLEMLNVHLYDSPGFFTTCRKLKELQVDGLSESLPGPGAQLLPLTRHFGHDFNYTTKRCPTRLTHSTLPKSSIFPNFEYCISIQVSLTNHNICNLSLVCAQSQFRNFTLRRKKTFPASYHCF